MAVPPLYVVSGGLGTSGEQLVRTVLAQFPDADVPVHIVPHVQDADRLQAVVAQATATAGTIVHTLVDADLRHTLTELARQHNVVAIDLMGRLLERLASVLAQDPAEQPGLYRRLRSEYFARVEAIEFAVQHDDGQRARDLNQADIVLVGVSRAGKTPLSMYLAMRGWRVANVPLIKDITPPPELFALDPKRVIGLVINPVRLAEYRRRRQHGMGLARLSDYSDPDQVFEEVEVAQQYCRQHGFTLLDTTDKPIEECAEQVIGLITRRFGDGAGTQEGV